MHHPMLGRQALKKRSQSEAVQHTCPLTPGQERELVETVESVAVKNAGGTVAYENTAKAEAKEACLQALHAQFSQRRLNGRG